MAKRRAKKVTRRRSRRRVSGIIPDKNEILSVAGVLAGVVGASYVSKYLPNSLDTKVKVYLIDQLKKVLDILDNYQIYGHEKLVDILEKSIGHVIVDKNYEKFMCDSSQSESWKKYLTDLSTVITLSSGTMPLLQSLQSYLS